MSQKHNSRYLILIFLSRKKIARNCAVHKTWNVRHIATKKRHIREVIKEYYVCQLNSLNIVDNECCAYVVVTHSRIQSHFLFGKLLLIEQFIYTYFFPSQMCLFAGSLRLSVSVPANAVSAQMIILLYFIQHNMISDTWQCAEWIVYGPLVAGCWTKCCLAIIFIIEINLNWKV